MRILITLLFISFNAFSQQETIERFRMSGVERYKLYPTQNINIHLKLDTQNGYVYMVQRGSSEVRARDIQVNAYRPAALKEPKDYQAVIGRYKLYPTENIWTFWMQDVLSGYTYQVQWGFERENRWIKPIYSPIFK